MAQKKTSKSSKKPAKSTQKKTTSSASKKTQSKSEFPYRIVSAGVLLVLAVLALIACISTEGSVPYGIRMLLCGLFGKIGFYLSPVMLFCFVWMVARHRGWKLTLRCVSLALLWVTICALSQLSAGFPDTLNPGTTFLSYLFDQGTKGFGGGVLGGYAGYGLFETMGKGAGIFTAVVLCILFFMMSIGITIPSLIRAIQNRPRAPKEPREEEDRAARVVNHIANKAIEHQERKALRKSIADYDLPVDDEPAPKPRKKEKPTRPLTQILDEELSQRKGRKPAPVHTDDDLIQGTSVIPAAEHHQLTVDDLPENPIPEPRKEEMPVPPVQIPVEEVVPAPPVKEPVDEATMVQLPQVMPEPAPIVPVQPDPAHDKVTSREARQSAQEVAFEIAQNQQEAKPEYHFPPINLLNLSNEESADGTSEMRENSRRLNEALQSFKIEAHICNVTRGPSVTRYEVELAQGVRLAKITALQDDIALALGATGVRIAAIPDKIAVVGIEVPNKQVTKVPLREVIDSPAFKKAKSKSSFAVGKDIGGSCVVGDISRLPHMLIAGTTGSGKSVCMNSIIISILYKASPDDVKLIMVDPKMVELGIYNGIPHLLIPVVTDPKKAAGSLQWAVTEMMRRYRIMSDAGVRDLASFNGIVEGTGEGEKLPQVVVIIDELADLMLVAAKEVEESICRIAQMGRAAGIHLVIATQRPSADVITGLMKANIPSRIAFAVASAMESRIILDTQGAEKLVGRGDMLFAPLGNGKPKRVQGCFVTDDEVEAIATYVKENYTSDYDAGVLEEIERKAEQTGKGGKNASVPEPAATEYPEEEEGGDELLPAAVDVILETGQASVSMLQRRLKLGYARAARIVDEMEERGIVGPFAGSKPRAILVTKEQWAAMKGEAPMDDTLPNPPVEDLID